MPQMAAAELAGMETQRAGLHFVEYRHLGIGIGAPGGDVGPEAERRQQRLVVERQRIHPQIRRFSTPGFRFVRLHQRHLQALARGHQRGGQADHAAADHGDIDIGACHKTSSNTVWPR